MSKSFEVTIFHMPDAEVWCKYLKELFAKNKETRVNSLDLDSMDYENPPEVQQAVLQTCVIVLLGSPDLQDFMKDKVWLSNTLCNVPERTTVVVALCFEDSKEFVDSLLEDYSTSSSWKHFFFSQDASANIQAVASMLEIVDENAPLPPIASRSKKKSTRSPVSLKVIPHRVYSPKSDVVLAFRNEVKCTIQVRFSSKDKSVPDNQMKYDTKKLNPYTYKFKTPDKPPGSYLIHVYQDARDVFTAPFYFVAPHEVAFSSVQYLCQSFQCKDLPGLDAKLVDIIEKSLPEDESLSALFAKVKEGLNSGSSKSHCEFPTLLHFAAANGLSDFCSLLLEVPCSQKAFQIENCDGKDPADLAEKDHPELAQYIRDFMATKYIADSCDLYMEMTMGYRNVEHTNPDVESDYMSMGDTQPRALSGMGGYVTAVQTDTPPPLQPRATTTKKLPPVPKKAHALRKASDPGMPRYTAPPPPPGALARTKSERIAASERPVSSEPPEVQRRGNTLPANINPASLMAMMAAEERELPQQAMGSTSQNELIEILQGVKEGNFTQQQAGMLFKSWQERNGDGQTKSFKERQKTLRRMRDEYSTVIDKMEQQARVESKPSFFGRLISKRKKPIQNIPQISGPIPEAGSLRTSRGISHPMDRVSSISTASSSSSSSRESTSSFGNDPYCSSDDSDSGHSGAAVQFRSSLSSSGSFDGEPKLVYWESVQLRASRTSGASLYGEIGAKRQSRRLDFLAETEEEPPLLPPRTYTKTDPKRPSLRPMPLPKR